MEAGSLGRENKVLVVDDDNNVRLFLIRFLQQKTRLSALSAVSGEEALKIIQSDNIKLVLLDIKLPDMDGIEVLRRIKKINKNISVIMITAFREGRAAQDAIREGASDYILKPFDLAYLKISVADKIAKCIQNTGL